MMMDLTPSCSSMFRKLIHSAISNISKQFVTLSYHIFMIISCLTLKLQKLFVANPATTVWLDDEFSLIIKSLLNK